MQGRIAFLPGEISSCVREGDGEIRREKSAEGIVAARQRRAEREGEPDVVALERVQVSEARYPGWIERGNGESGPEAERDETLLACRQHEGLG